MFWTFELLPTWKNVFTDAIDVIFIKLIDRLSIIGLNQHHTGSFHVLIVLFFIIKFFVFRSRLGYFQLHGNPFDRSWV